jgi:hypothetical protein
VPRCGFAQYLLGLHLQGGIQGKRAMAILFESMALFAAR